MNFLENIAATVRSDLVCRKRQIPSPHLERKRPFPLRRGGFANVFKQNRFSVIAELKKASPSKGVIRANFHPAELAVELEAAGAAALSVLTEPRFFGGSTAVLQAVSERVGIPCLRKDFIVDEYQLEEARCYGADAVLLIVALLGRSRLDELVRAAHSLDLDVLVESHDEAELETALGSEADLIGVNARDLNTFQCSSARCEMLIRRIPENRLVIAESAIRSHDDLIRLHSAGAAGFLIGETLMRAVSPGAELRRLIGARL